MKNGSRTVRLAFLCMALLATAPLFARGQAQRARTITVVGEGTVETEPETASVQIGVEAYAPDVQQALSAARGRIDRVVAALRNQGVADEDMQTAQYSIHLERGYSPGREDEQPAPQYRVSNTLRVTLRNLDGVAAAIDAAVSAGANQMYGISFSVGEARQSELQREAIAAAAADARSRAEHLAGLHQAQLGDVLSISEIVGGGGGGDFTVQVERMSAGTANVRPGKLQFTARLQVVFAITP